MNQPDEIHSFAADFEPSSDEQWRGLVDKVLKGAAFDAAMRASLATALVPGALLPNSRHAYRVPKLR